MANIARSPLRTVEGDIWKVSTPNDTIVIPTNVGWKTSDGKNPMGKGLAAQAARRFRFLPKLYGDFCKKYRDATPLLPLRVTRWCEILILLPTKELDPEKPYLSWKHRSSADALVARLKQLQKFATSFHLAGHRELHYTPDKRILVPALGCGYGGLPPGLVETLLIAFLIHPCFVYVKRAPELTGEDK